MEAPRIMVALAIFLSGCGGVQTRGCPGNKIGVLNCSGGVCKPSFDGEVFYRIYEAPTNAEDLLKGIELRGSNKIWFLSSAGNFKVFVGGPNNGVAYKFKPTEFGWVAELEKDAYACSR